MKKAIIKLSRLSKNHLNSIIEHFFSSFLQLIRITIVLGAILRYFLTVDETSKSINIIWNLVIITLVVMNVIIVIRNFRTLRLYQNTKWIKFQIWFDIIIISIMYYLTMSAESDLFLFYILPLFIAGEYLGRLGIIRVFISISIMMFGIIFFLSLNSPEFGSLSLDLARVFLPRWTFFLFIIFLALYKNRLVTGKMKEYEAIYNIGISILEKTGMDDRLNEIVKAAKEILNGDGSGLYLRVPGTNDVRLVASIGYDNERIPNGTIRGSDVGITGQILSNNLPFFIEADYPNSPFCIPNLSDKFLSVIEIPLSNLNPSNLNTNTQGVLTVFSNSRRGAFDDKDLLVLMRLGQLSAFTIRENILSTTESVLLEVGSALISDQDFRNLSNLILKLLRKIVPFDTASIHQLKEDQLEIVSCEGFPNFNRIIGLKFPLIPKYPNYVVISSGEPLALRDVKEEYLHFQNESNIFHSDNIVSWLGIPLIVRGKTLGMISIDRHYEMPFSFEEINHAVSFANQAAIALENAIVLDISENRASALEFLHHIVNLIISDPTYDSVLPQIVLGAIEMTNHDSSAIFIVEKKQDRYFVSESFSYPENLSLPAPNLAKLTNITRAVIDSGEVLTNAQISVDDYPKLYNAGINALIALPIIIDDSDVGSHVCGVLYVFSNQPHEFSDEEIEMLDLLVDHAAVAISNTKRFHKERSIVEELRTTEETLQRIIDLYSDQRDLARIGKIYGESVHYAKNKLGIAKRSADNIYKGFVKQNKVSETARKIISNIDDYLSVLEKLKDNAVQEIPEVFELHKIIDEVIQSKQIDQNYDLQRYYYKSKVIISGFRQQLKQVLFVVFDNALRAMGRKGGEIFVRTEYIIRNEKEAIRISVSDTGGGISNSVKKHIFELIKIEKTGGGERMGLPWARSFLRSIEGDIFIEDENGIGTTVIIIVPMDITSEFEE